MTVRVLPNAVVIDCGKPATTPPAITLMPPTFKVCKPSAATTVKVPDRVSAAASGWLPSLRFFSYTVNSPAPAFSSPRVT
ncbi:hypothetical protein D9M73_171850 [compost metagenome]